MNCLHCGECDLVGDLVFSQEVLHRHISQYLKFRGIREFVIRQLGRIIP